VSTRTIDRLQRWELSLLEKAATEVPVEVIGPFRAIPGRTGELVGFNYALPVDPLDERLAAAIRALRSLYQARHEPLRLEFNQETWPELGAALERAGLTLESRNPLMACEPEEFRPFSAPSVSVRFLDVDPRYPSTLRAVGELDGEVAGRASMGTVEGVAELYGVVTDPPFRRRGVAASICSALVGRLFRDGGTLAFLDAENPGAEALYARLGFRPIGARLSYAAPDPDPPPEGEGLR
jgi:ribosomal protein S18 acetylase RimI-like enzyme